MDINTEVERRIGEVADQGKERSDERYQNVYSQFEQVMDVVNMLEQKVGQIHGKLDEVQGKSGLKFDTEKWDKLEEKVLKNDEKTNTNTTYLLKKLNDFK